MSNETEVVIDEKISKATALPKKYKVILLNDEVTPIDFVIEVLTTIFKYSKESAENLTMTVHLEGSAVAGTYSYEIAEQKTLEAVTLSREHGFPLNITLEQE